MIKIASDRDTTELTMPDYFHENAWFEINLIHGPTLFRSLL